MNINTLKTLHVICAATSYGLFFVRGIWSLHGSPMLGRIWVKVAPHLIDTLLLGSAIALAVKLHVSLFGAPWLVAKIIALLIYIVLGEIAIRYGKTPRVRLLAWLGAQSVFFCIAATAIAHDPLPWHAW